MGKEPLEQIMRRIGGSYVYWYNQKYDRIGNLFQGRFKSEPVENDAYFLAVLRYIHQNPIKAGIVNNIKDYKWSSYNEYLEDEGITDRQHTLKMFGEETSMALERFIHFSSQISDEKALDIEEKKKISDDKLRETIQKVFNVKAVMIQNEPKARMEILLRKILDIEGVSARQLARVTGISVNFIWKL